MEEETGGRIGVDWGEEQPMVVFKGGRDTVMEGAALKASNYTIIIRTTGRRVTSRVITSTTATGETTRAPPSHSHTNTALTAAQAITTTAHHHTRISKN